MNISFEKIDTNSKSMKDIASKRKSVNLNERSLRPRLLRQKLSISSSEISKKSLDKSQSKKSFKNLHSRNSLILKTKRRKVSFVQVYGFNASKKVKAINSKKLKAKHPKEVESTTKYLEECDSNGKNGEENKKLTRNNRKLKMLNDKLDALKEDSEVECTEISSKIPYGSKRRGLSKRGKSATNYTEQECISIEEIDIEEQEQVKNKRKRKLRSDAPEIECTGMFSEVSCNSKKKGKGTNNKNEQKAVSVKGTECESKKIIKTKQNLKKTDTSDEFHKNSEVKCKEILAEITSNSKKRRRGNATDLFNEHKESSVQGIEYVENKEIKKKRNMKSKNIYNKSDALTNSEVESKDITAKIPCNSKKRKRGKNTKSFNEQKDILVKGIEFVENKEVKSKRARSVKKTNDKSESLKISETECRGIFSEIPCDSKRGRRKKNAADNIEEQKDLLVKGIETEENRKNRNLKNTEDKLDLKLCQVECKEVFTKMLCDSKRGRRKKATNNINEHKDHSVKGTTCEENEGIKKTRKRKVKTTSEDSKVLQEMEVQDSPKRGRRRRNDKVKGISLKEKKSLIPKDKGRKQTKSVPDQSIESPVHPKKRNRIR